ncbi:hypothetical protein ACFE04_000376 [Oxalis oulophora]
MHPQQSSRIDLGDLKSQLVKKIGPEKAKRYFYYFNRFLSQKLSKNEFDSLCVRTIGKENIRLHNQLIRSILKNACQAKTPPEVGPTKSSPIEDAQWHEQSGSLVPNQNQNVPAWSNGVLPVSPRKIRSRIPDRKFRDRPSPLGPNGKVENGVLAPCDYRRPIQNLQPSAEQPENDDRENSNQRLKEKLRLPDKARAQTVIEDSEQVERESYLNFSRSALIPPLGLPVCSPSVSGARKVSSASDFVSNYECGELYNTVTLQKRMEQIAASQGLGGVTMDCANILNNMLDVYLKKLIRSSVELVGSRSDHDPRKYPAQRLQAHGKIVNGMWPTNHVPNSGPIEQMQEQKSRSSSVSLLDFKVAMELNPQQLGEDWPVLLERICTHTFEE